MGLSLLVKSTEHLKKVSHDAFYKCFCKALRIVWNPLCVGVGGIYDYEGILTLLIES